ncbi:MFS transporter [Patulibacter americanus]|uniref:MFS transporter n=1 Tax=Patulibacter americanus TaxID=588672 RepID=UPI0003B38B7A|nr:MFS transporter [Patulibacter americanus]
MNAPSTAPTGASVPPGDRAARRAQAQGNPWLTLVAVALGVMMVGLDGTVVGVANPTIAADLDASLAGLQWVTNGYLLALAVLLILGGKLGDRFGRKKVFIIGIVGFAITSLGCALSPSIGALIFFRVLQGVAGALLMPNTLALIRAAFPPNELNRAVGIWGGSSALAVASGPIIGGLLVEHVSWESIFLLNLPLGLLATVVAVAWVKESREESHAGGFDVPGVALLSGGLFLLVWALIKAQDKGWGSAYVLLFGLAGVIVLGLFVLREHRAADPLLPLDIFRERSVWAGTLLVIVGFFALFGVLFFIGLYLQNTHGYSPVQTGVRMLPLTAVFVISAPLGGFLTERYGPRPPLILGMLLLVVAFFGLTMLETDTSYNGQWPYFLIIGLSFGLIIVSTTQAIVGNVSVERGGVAGGLQSTAQQLGGVLGTAVFGSIIASSVAGNLADNLAAERVPAPVAAVVSRTGELVSQGVSPADAARAPQELTAGLAQANGGELTPEVARAVSDASYGAFMDGLHAAMYVGVGLAVVAALLGLLVTRGREVEAHEAGAA